MIKRNFKSMNDSINNTFERSVFNMMVVATILWVATMCTVVYVAHHFITKFW